MKIYVRILGIATSVIILVCIIILINLVIQSELDWLSFFIFLLPLYIIIHFTIATKFGFYETKNKDSFFVISSISSIIILIIIPLVFFFTDRNEQQIIEKNEMNQQKELSESIEKLKTPILLGKDTTVYNIECQLKTRYADGNFEYIFSAKYLKDERVNIEAFIVELHDSSGFVVTEITIDSWTRALDTESKNLIGYTKNSKIEFFDAKEYQRIETFNVAIRTAD